MSTSRPKSSQRKTITATKLTQRDVDSSSHRLSRVPNKYTVPKAAKSEQPESYAISFFNNNPDIQLDKRSPTEKLEEINSRIHDEELDENERFNYLVQRKSLSFLAYGENSVECFEALRDLGIFYNRQNRPESALRHLLKAQQIINNIEISDEDGISLAIALSEAYLSSKASTKAENTKQLNNAEITLSPYIDADVEDKMLAYKRDLLLARIKSRRNKYDEALINYDRAIDSLNNAHEGRKVTTTAGLFIEIGECAENQNDMKTAIKMYKRAYDTFIELNMPDSAKLIENRIPPNYDENANENIEEEEETETNILTDTMNMAQDKLLNSNNPKSSTHTSAANSQKPSQQSSTRNSSRNNPNESNDTKSTISNRNEEEDNSSDDET